MKKRLISLILAALMMVSLAACGGGGSAATPNPSAAPSAPNTIQYSQGASDTEVLIANSAATSGAYAPVGVPFTAGIQAYLNMVNEAGASTAGRSPSSMWTTSSIP
jgi:predicted small lipoprotein YifL